MWRVAATLLLVASFLLVNGSTSVSGQTSCIFVGGFARIRDLVGAEKVGACLEDEHFNSENQNAEQLTTGGLLVWRKSDNFTAFTDGGTTWINGPGGLQSRANNERFPWETDLETTSRTASTSPAPPVVEAPARLESPASPPAGSPVAAVQAAAATATKPPTATIVPTAVRTPTKTPNPVEIKITEKPDDADTGSEVKFEVETNGKKGSCSLTITYNDTAAAGVGSPAIDDGKCEWKFILPTGTKTGTAKFVVTVSAENGTNTKEDEFKVRKGDQNHSGDLSMSLELKESPGDVDVGESFKVEIETDVGNKGTCDASATWPKANGSLAGESKKPDGGKCSWTFLVPTSITKSGTATLTVWVKNSKGASRTITKEFDVKTK
jgi:hypothetical protein